MDDNNKYFRAGVGSVIYNEGGQVLVFKRLAPPTGIWQFQQGGIDAGEQLENTLWRELKEEAGIDKGAILKTTPYPKWTVTEYPPEITKSPDNPMPLRIGQAHRWFFLEIDSNITIDLAKATDNEFSDFKWIQFADIFNMTSDYRRQAYEELYKFFISTITGKRT